MLPFKNRNHAREHLNACDNTAGAFQILYSSYRDCLSTAFKSPVLFNAAL